MTKKTAWSHLPNAAHIDGVLASVKAHPAEWRSAWDAAWDAVWDAAWDAAVNAARHASRFVAYNAATGHAGHTAGDASYGAMLALVAYDDCAQYLDMSSDQLKVWAILSENPAAVLLLPAVIAFEKIAELEMA